MRNSFVISSTRTFFILMAGVIAIVVSIGFLFPNHLFGWKNDAKEKEGISSVQELIRLADSLKPYHIEAAKEKTTLAEKIVKQNGLDSLYPKVYMAQAELFLKNSEYPEALEKLMAAESFYRGALVLDDKKSNSQKIHLANCLQKISEVHFKLDRLDKSLEYIEAALKIYRELDDPYYIARATSNLGAIYFKQELYNEALSTYLEVLKYYKLSGEKVNLQTLYSNIGSANLILKNMDTSIEYLDMAETAILTAIDADPNNKAMDKELSQVYYIKSIYYYMVENQDLYEDYLHRSWEVLGDSYAPADAKAPLFTLHRLYSKKGDYEKAYNYLLMHQEINDSLFSTKNTSRIFQLEKEHELLENQRTYQLAKQKSERFYWTVLAGLLVVVLIILLFLNRQKRKIIQANKEEKRLNTIKSSLETELYVKEEILIKKESEVKKLASNIVAKNESINSLQDHVDQINRSLHNDISHKKIGDMIKTSRDREDIEKDRKQLLLNLEQISIPLFHNLDTDYKRLTKRQKLLAALVKQGFSAKEIAILFNITHKAAQTNKYRLKKSLKLNVDQDLDSFLKKYPDKL